MAGRTCLVTGATAGIGAEAAWELIRLGPVAVPTIADLSCDTVASPRANRSSTARRVGSASARNTSELETAACACAMDNT